MGLFPGISNRDTDKLIIMFGAPELAWKAKWLDADATIRTSAMDLRARMRPIAARRPQSARERIVYQ